MKARVVLQPLKTQTPKGSTSEKQSPEIKKRKRSEEEEKDTKQETRYNPVDNRHKGTTRGHGEEDPSILPGSK